MPILHFSINGSIYTVYLFLIVMHSHPAHPNSKVKSVKTTQPQAPDVAISQTL